MDRGVGGNQECRPDRKEANCRDVIGSEGSIDVELSKLLNVLINIDSIDFEFTS